MDWDIKNKNELIEILNKYNLIYKYSHEFIKRDEIYFLPIKFTQNHDTDFYSCIFGYVNDLFSHDLFKNLFRLDLSHLKYIDNKNFIICFAFRKGQLLN